MGRGKSMPKYIKKSKVFDSIIKDLSIGQEVILNSFYTDPVKSYWYKVKTTWPKSQHHFLMDFRKYLADHPDTFVIKPSQRKGTVLVKTA